MERKAKGLAFLLAAVFLAAGLRPVPAWAMEAGAYLVTVTPSYTDPESGKVEDPGNNEAIGQGMTQKLCGSQGLLEVDGAGNMYLTVRYYMSQFVSDVSFEERSGGSYQSRTWERMQEKAAVSGASDINEKYGSTDYRIPIASLDSVFRGKAYIEPMGRNVVYFFTVSGPAAGNGDFVVSVHDATGSGADTAGSSTASSREAAAGNSAASSREAAAGDSAASSRTAAGSSQTAGGAGTAADILDDAENGSGNADDPVTGIPDRPSDLGKGSRRGEGVVNALAGAADGTESLQTRYDLTAVPLAEARELTRPLLDGAVGLTGMAGEEADALLEEQGYAGGQSGGLIRMAGWSGSASRSGGSANQRIMTVLLAAAAILLARFAYGALAGRKPDLRAAETKGEEGEHVSQ